MNIQEIQEYLPHRYPMLLVDRVVELEVGKRILAFKNITLNESFFQGHFPGNPILPGVVIIEAMAQASGILGFKTVGRKPDEGFLYLFAGVTDVRFKKRVIPGDRLMLESRVQSSKRHIWKFECTATVDGELAVSALLTCAIIEA